VWYYAPILFAALLPAVPMAVGLGRNLLFGSEPERSPAGGFWLLAGLWCVLFFSVSGSKLPTYILPAVPPLCLAVGDHVARSRWDRSNWTKVSVGVFAGLMLGLHADGVPWYARERSPVGDPARVRPFVEDPSVPVVTYPRHCDSVAYLVGRADFDAVRSKDVNELMVAMHHRPRTVILFTHRHSFEAFRAALPESLAVTDRRAVDRTPTGFRPLDRLVGDTPWGLCDIAVVEPAGVARGQVP
jgi:hypothetical protein